MILSSLTPLPEAPSPSRPTTVGSLLFGVLRRQDTPPAPNPEAWLGWTPEVSPRGEKGQHPTVGGLRSHRVQRPSCGTPPAPILGCPAGDLFLASPKPPLAAGLLKPVVEQQNSSKVKVKKEMSDSAAQERKGRGVRACRPLQRAPWLRRWASARQAASARSSGGS